MRAEEYAAHGTSQPPLPSYLWGLRPNNSQLRQRWELEGWKDSEIGQQVLYALDPQPSQGRLPRRLKQ